jgi:SAM-dependent methyltransferase
MRKLTTQEQTASSWNLREIFSLLFLNLTVQVRSIIDFFKTAFRYYSNFQFMKVDLSLLLMYFFYSPYAISKRFLTQKGEEDVYAYGETPLTTMDLIAQECCIKKEDVFYELGCGRGRVCFWMHSFVGCQIVGIEFVPEFVKYANKIKDKLNLDHIEFRLEDMLKADYSEATVCYLYGTCLSDESIESLIQKFVSLPAGTKIITVSYPLSDYVGGESFEVMKRFSAPFTWGKGDVFLNVVKKLS